MEDKLDKIIELLEALVNASSTYKGYDKWTVEQENLLSMMYIMGAKIPEIIVELKIAFDVNRTPGAITSRIKKLGLDTVYKDSTPVTKETKETKPIMDSIYDAPF